MSSRLHVGNLEEHVSPDELRALFERAGRVLSLEIVRDPTTRRSKGYGFVEMATQQEGVQAIAMFNGHHLNFRPLVVKRAREGARRAPLRPK
ncbi:MAG TPA: RNA-binding protein [Candidatus Methylomirabilis sp.]|nr:RNA-binding protein [Candidatus Methylomirabilis sp.]